jgi:leucyl aminopeptidase
MMNEHDDSGAQAQIPQERVLDGRMRWLAGADVPCLPIVAVRPAGLQRVLGDLSAGQRAWVEQHGFGAEAGRLLLVPGVDGIERALLGLGAGRGPFLFGGLAGDLPVRDWAFDGSALAACGVEAAEAVLGFGLGAYRFREAPVARVVCPAACGAVTEMVEAVALARDLVNTPANLLGPAELADAVGGVAARFGAAFRRVEGEALESQFPAIAAVGRGSARAPVMAALSWQGSKAGPDAPLVSLVGKGVCFDTGGYDLKPSSAMLRMKKDMGGAAVVLGVASLVMRRDLPVRLELRVGCVENSVSGTAMRPSDVIRTRAGLTVEVNNTDAEGRLVLADLLAEAAEAAPGLLIDVATLTGAARVALGPDLPALFTDDDGLAVRLLAAGREAGDPMWRLPLWDGYDDWLKSGAADLSNVSAKPMAGAVTAALFLRRFVPASVSWAHVDAYCWNDSSRPGRPEGGESPGLRAIYSLITNLCEDGTAADDRGVET